MKCRWYTVMRASFQVTFYASGGRPLNSPGGWGAGEAPHICLQKMSLPIPLLPAADGPPGFFEISHAELLSLFSAIRKPSGGGLSTMFYLERRFCVTLLMQLEPSVLCKVVYYHPIISELQSTTFDIQLGGISWGGHV